MRAFACYTALCVVVAGVVSFAVVVACMEAYRSLYQMEYAGRPEIDSGPYVYDASSGELVPAVSIDLANGIGDRILFVGLRGGTGRATVEGAADGAGMVIQADTERLVVYATLDMLKHDEGLSIMDWGANYTEQDYSEAHGNPYDPRPIAVEDLASYDAQERSERAQVVSSLEGALARLDDADDDVVLSNIGYYVSSADADGETAPLFALRVAAGLAPFVVLGVCAVMTFRRFYRTRLAEPLGSLRAAADRIAAQDLDFTVEGVRGREFGSLSAVLERMRASLAHAQRALMETAEERRRLNAAFAHDLRTPLTVLKGTIEMMRADAAPGADRRLAAMEGQVDRLEAYAQAMSGVNKLDERVVERRQVPFAALAGDAACTARMIAERAGRSCTVEIGSGGVGSQDADSVADGSAAHPVEPGGAGPCMIMVDAGLVDEVLGNLVTNACRYARKAVRVGMRVQSGDEGARLVLEVFDDGPGFSGEALRHGCEAFYSEEKSAEHFGLGLAVALTLTRLHGGTLVLGGAAEGGARVTATFDVAAPCGADRDWNGGGDDGGAVSPRRS